jgi:tRNA A37 threonylcarbamoyladenosine dehydratase
MGISPAFHGVFRYFGKQKISSFQQRYFQVSYRIMMKTISDQIGRKKREVIQLQGIEFQVDTCQA